MARARSTAAPPQAVPGSKDHEHPAWITSEPSGVGWVDEVRERHLAAVTAFADAAAAEAEAVSAQRQDQAEHRAEVRRAVASGQEPPEPPDPAVAEAKVSVAREDVIGAQDALARVAIDALAALRAPEHRAEIETLMVRFSPALRHSLREGPGGRISGRLAELRRELARLEGPAIEVITDDSPTEVTSDV
jgi:hypothetical protein